MIVRHTLVNNPGWATSPPTEPPLRGTLAGVAHHGHRRLHFLRLIDLLLNDNFDGSRLGDVSGGRRGHDARSWRGDTPSARRLLNWSRRLDCVVLGVCNCPGLGRNLDCSFR